MKEVELKARLSEPSAQVMALEKRGCVFSQPITQDDAVFVKQTGTIEEYLSNADYLRLRVEGDGTTLFTLKHHAGRSDDPHDAPTEHETKVASREAAEHILTTLGFIQAVRIKKTRRKTRYENWEVCIDAVEGLGSFIEIEEMVPETADVPAVLARMQTFLESLDVKEGDMHIERYDMLLLRQGI